jgi:integrase
MKLQEGRIRDLAFFNIAIDSKLRGCDVVALKVDDVASSGYAADRASVRQKKTGRPVKFELTEPTRQAIDDYLRATSNKRAFPSVDRHRRKIRQRAPQVPAQFALSFYDIER